MVRFPLSTASLLALGLGLGTVASGTALAADGPSVVVDIAPLHGLVSSVLGDLGEAHQLVPNGGSPHDFAMRPSDARALSKADLVVWVGPGLSPFLVKPLETLSDPSASLEMEDLQAVTRLPYRDFEDEDAHGDHHDEDGQEEHDDHDDHDHEAHDNHDEDHDHDHEAHDDHDHDEDHDHGHHHHGTMDPHLWLNVDNALALVDAVEGALTAKDPAHGATYAANAAATRDRLTALKGWVSETLAPLEGKGYMVFHDAYQYLEIPHGPHAVGALTLSPEVNPGARRVTEAKERVISGKAACVFAEPQFPTALVDQVVEGTEARGAVLDPLGAAIPQGAGHYEGTVRSLVQTLADCLSGK